MLVWKEIKPAEPPAPPPVSRSMLRIENFGGVPFRHLDVQYADWRKKWEVVISGGDLAYISVTLPSTGPETTLEEARDLACFVARAQVDACAKDLAELSAQIEADFVAENNHIDATV